MALEEGNKQNAPKWYVLKAYLVRYKADEALAEEMLIRGRAGDDELPVLEYFVPHLEEKKLVNGKMQDVSSPLCGYVFLRGTARQVSQFCYTHPKFCKIRGFGDHSDYLSVTDRAMDDFKLIVRAYNANNKNVPFIATSPALLERGDRVRILEGDFCGVEGTLVTSQGKDSGRVVINVGDGFYVPTLEIKFSQLQVISFAGSNHHAYQKLDSYAPVMLKVMERFLKDGYLDDTDKAIAADMAKVRRFVVQYGSLEIKSEKQRSRFLSYIVLSRLVLEKQGEADGEGSMPLAHYVDGVMAGMKAVTNPVSQAFVYTVLYAATGKKDFLRRAEGMAKTWLGNQRDDKEKAALPPKKREVVGYIDLYSKYLRFGVEAVECGHEGLMMALLPSKTYTSEMGLDEILAAFPPEYLERVVRELGFDSTERLSAGAVAGRMLKQPRRLFDAIRQSEDDLRLVRDLISASPDAYVIRSKRPNGYLVQSLGLVATYEHIDNAEWHMLMPSEVGKALQPYLRPTNG